MYTTRSGMPRWAECKQPKERQNRQARGLGSTFFRVLLLRRGGFRESQLNFLKISHAFAEDLARYIVKCMQIFFEDLARFHMRSGKFWGCVISSSMGQRVWHGA